MPYGRRGCRRNEGEPIPTVRRARTRHLEEDEEPATADAEGLRRFLEGEVLPWFEARKKELANRPLIREQAFGEALDPDKLERLGRYEVHLDRKFERTLAMLLRLKTCGRGDRGVVRVAKPMAGGTRRRSGGLLSAMRRAQFTDGLLQPASRNLRIGFQLH